jgi:hypothetical protein
MFPTIQNSNEILKGEHAKLVWKRTTKRCDDFRGVVHGRLGGFNTPAHNELENTTGVMRGKYALDYVAR